ncbi:tRNA pseudouridine(55) synthase TruB [Patescibacteria group bacterium]|nr:MAG: tRNA pseudouridine(55) synthase TruB [Patescibacteria group bacterium]
MQAAPSGFLAIDKPADWTSHDVVAKLRRITGVKTIGHAGTLDPFATGLLIVGVGRAATKRLSEFQKQEKEYLATARFDGSSDTDDVTGTVTLAAGDAEPGLPTARSEASTGGMAERQDPRPRVIEAFAAEVGTRMQTPPAYSAKKIGGKKMYDLARAGTPVEAKPAEITIRDITVTRVAWPEVDFRIVCSTGTYVRAVARDVGKRLGAGGYLTALRRTRSGDKNVSDAVPLEQLAPGTWKTYLWK